MSLSNKALAAFAVMAVPVTENVFASSKRVGTLFRAGQEKAREEANKAIVSELGAIASTMDERKLQYAQTAQALRRQATSADEAGEAIDTAFAYGETTDNYLPLLAVLDIVSENDYVNAGVSRTDWKELCTIPEGWTAPVVSGS